MMPGDPFIAYQGNDPNDTRFQFDVIKHLSESVRQLAAGMADMQKTQVGMLERLATLEASKFSTSIDTLEKDVAALMRDKDQRRGMMDALGALPKVIAFLVTIASIFSAIYLAGRATGVISPPPMAPTRVEATIHPEPRPQETAAGGKP